MMLKKFTGASTREALKKLREDLGDEAVILSTKQTASGTEILAALAEDLPAAVQRPAASSMPAHPGMGEPFAAPVVSANTPNMVKREVQPVSWKRIEEVREQERAQEHEASQLRDFQREPAAPVRTASLREQELEMTRPVMEELRQMREMLSEQMSVLNWRTAMEKNPARADLWRDLTEAGFSAVFARTVVEKLPDTLSGEDSRRWLGEVMTRNLNICPAADEIVERGGVYALVGPTGVGKTTTTAKMAARCVVKYGAQSLGLITTDSYRIGAQDQLRIYGKILGVQVYTAQTDADLAQLLASLSRKHLVLIDTVGMGQRDERVEEQTRLLALSNVKRVLLLNAVSQAETLEDVARNYRGDGLHGAIITKMDEAVKLGGVLDVVIRHKLNLHYMATGQRVPEDLFPAEATALLRRALKPSAKNAFSMSDKELEWKMAKMPASDDDWMN
jgi:flagellar biosynthesis protein FlhF